MSFDAKYLKSRNGSVINYYSRLIEIFFLAKNDAFSVNGHYYIIFKSFLLIFVGIPILIFGINSRIKEVKRA